jgi:hypothetical protein
VLYLSQSGNGGQDRITAGDSLTSSSMAGASLYFLGNPVGCTFSSPSYITILNSIILTYAVFALCACS